jgi:hypothetical protein
MLVRALCNHYSAAPRNAYRREGEEFDWDGPPYEHIEPVEPERKKASDKPAKN